MTDRTTDSPVSDLLNWVERKDRSAVFGKRYPPSRRSERRWNALLAQIETPYAQITVSDETGSDQWFMTETSLLLRSNKTPGLYNIRLMDDLSTQVRSLSLIFEPGRPSPYNDQYARAQEELSTKYAFPNCATYSGQRRLIVSASGEICVLDRAISTHLLTASGPLILHIGTRISDIHRWVEHNELHKLLGKAGVRVPEGSRFGDPAVDKKVALRVLATNNRGWDR